MSSDRSGAVAIHEGRSIGPSVVPALHGQYTTNLSSWRLLELNQPGREPRRVSCLSRSPSTIHTLITDGRIVNPSPYDHYSTTEVGPCQLLTPRLFVTLDIAVTRVFRLPSSSCRVAVQACSLPVEEATTLRASLVFIRHQLAHLEQKPIGLKGAPHR
jgi:hypothetical protein